MKKYSQILTVCPLFRDIAADSLFVMLNCLGAKIQEFARDGRIFAEGSQVRHIGILLSGSAQTVRVDYRGNRSIVSEILPGEVFAEAFACAEVSSIPVDIIAGEHCCVMLIDCGHILHTCHNSCGFHHRLIFNLMKELAQKNLQMHRRIEITSHRSTREKLLAYLDFYSKKTGSTGFDIPFDRQGLADYLEVERSGLSAEIGKLRREGVLTCSRNHFELLG